MTNTIKETTLSVLIAGFGDVGHRIAIALHSAVSSLNSQQQIQLELHAIRRKPEEMDNVSIHCCDMSQPIVEKLPSVDYVIFCVSADQLTEKGYQATYIDAQRHLISALTEQAINVKHYFFCSSTSVYGQTNHEWVDESSITAPTRFTGVKMLEAESVANSAPWPATSIRATGLYGPGRTRMINQVRSSKVAAAEPKCYSNRIHVDDLAAFYAHLILEHHLNDLPLAPLYLASDDTPVAIHEVQEWMARKLGIKELERIPAGRTGSKRISNERMKSTGFKLKYPSYMEGMPKLLTKTME